VGEEVCAGIDRRRVAGAVGLEATDQRPARHRGAVGVRQVPRPLTDVEGAPAFPRLKKPPAGVAVKLQKVTFVDPDEGPTTRKGFTCTAGSQTASWPAPVVSDWRFDVRPDKVVWVSATPALFYVEGKATDPIGRTARERRYFRACEPAAMREVRWLGNGLWAEMKWIVKGDDVVGAAWIVHLDAQPIAVVAGERFEVAPS